MNRFGELLSQVLTNSNTYHSIKVTFQMALFSTGISSFLGIFLGLLLERAHFPGKQIIVRLNRTLMGVPPVVVGLVVYLLVMRRGLLGPLGLLYNIKAMVLAQTLIITPIICGMVYSYALKTASSIRTFAKIMGASKLQTDFLLLKEMKNEIFFTIVTGFGRSISEVGAVMLVGGNIKGQTRTMTTTISLLKSQGIFQEGVVLGLILLVMAFVLQCLADFFRKEETTNDNY